MAGPVIIFVIGVLQPFYLVKFICSIFSLVLVLCCLTYKIVLEDQRLIEKVLGLNLRIVELNRIQRIEQGVAWWGPGEGIPITVYPVIRGDSRYRYFPVLQVSDRLIKSILEQKPNVWVDPYFANLLPESLRQQHVLALTSSDKAGNMLGYILYTIFYIVVFVIAVSIIIGTVYFFLNR